MGTAVCRLRGKSAMGRAGIDVSRRTYAAGIPVGFRFLTARLGDFAPAGATKGRRPLESCRLCKGGRNFYLRFALSFSNLD